MEMTKTEAKEIFGGTLQGVATAIGITKQGVCKWPNKLNQEQQDRIIGAAIRINRPIPEKLLKKFKDHVN